MSAELFNKLNENINLLYQQLGRDDITIVKVSGADFFYTDGAACGASFKINPLGLYYKEDGSEHFCWSADISNSDRAIINTWITSMKTS